MNSRSNTHALGGLAIFVIAAAVFISNCVVSDPFYSRDLEGRVVNEGSRLKATDNGAHQKISLVVQATTAPDSVIQNEACGPSGCAVECLSTRCASIIQGTCHKFECKRDVRWFEPSVIACKHEKEIECPAITAPVGGLPAQPPVGHDPPVGEQPTLPPQGY